MILFTNRSHTHTDISLAKVIKMYYVVIWCDKKNAKPHITV